MIAGMVEHMAMFPIDTIKTRMQVLGSCPIKSVVLRQALQSILKSDGPAGLYRGIGAMGLGAEVAVREWESVQRCKLSRSNPLFLSHTHIIRKRVQTKHPHSWTEQTAEQQLAFVSLSPSDDDDDDNNNM
ncbi:hypothetical protein L1987_10031 [Smallanthus sonchifolius]|uniref:Uncharacterized protein n=1 Tax=Smallanthus sonchifolius TaxID=185202 RepID=A0ACB9JQY0_9ASTR|nr:hypothetical protein L1987_10031 [Smallanthus sonchifolius]